MINNKLNCLAVLLLGLVFSLSGCGGSGSEAEESLEDRVLARWGYLIERDFESALAYYTPGFRQANPVDEFVRDMTRRPVRWHSAELTGITCEEDVCEVELLIEFQAAGAPAGMARLRVNSEQEERWIRLDGEWWYVAN